MHDDPPESIAPTATPAEPGSARYAIGDLAEAAGVSRRAVRFYVQRGLVAAPLGAGRGAYYDASHLAQLLEIKRRQEAGAPLQAIAEAFESDGPPPPLLASASPIESWARLVLAKGVELHVRADALTPAQQAVLIQAARAVLPAFEATTEGDSA